MVVFLSPIQSPWSGQNFANITKYDRGDDSDNDVNGYYLDGNIGPFTDATEQEDTVYYCAHQYMEGDVKGEGMHNPVANADVSLIIYDSKMKKNHKRGVAQEDI